MAALIRRTRRFFLFQKELSSAMEYSAFGF
jgi:hypothetical protein